MLDDRAERLGVDLRSAENLEVEIARRRIDCRIDDTPDLFLLHIVIVTVEVVDRRERPVLGRSAESLRVDDG